MMLTMTQYIIVFQQFRFLIILINVESKQLFQDLNLRMSWEFKMHMAIFISTILLSYLSFKYSFLNLKFIFFVYCCSWWPQIFQNSLNGYKYTP